MSTDCGRPCDGAPETTGSAGQDRITDSAAPWPDCAKCENAYMDTLPFPQCLMRRMLLCPTCGNKRCPKATDHNLDCTGSNETGQPGSRYGGIF